MEPTAHDLFTWTPPSDKFDGKTYEPEHDKLRLTGQIKRTYDALLDGRWKTLTELSFTTGDPEASVSARLRDLRKAKFGGLDIQRQRRGEPSLGLFEYRMVRAK